MRSSRRRWGRRAGAAVLILLLGCGDATGPSPARIDRPEAPSEIRGADATDRPALSPAERYLGVARYGEGDVDDSGYALSSRWTGAVADRGDLGQVVASVRGRNRRGIEAAERQLAAIDPKGPDAAQLRVKFEREIGLLFLYEGAFDDAERWLDRALREAEDPLVPVGIRENLIALRAVAALRRGESENCVACVGPSSCIWPIVPEAAHQFPDGALRAAEGLADYLRCQPEDLAMRWVLRVATATLGDDPDRLPPELSLPIGAADTAAEIGRFENVATTAGLLARGPDMAGGVAFDDFDGDGRPDLFWTSFEVDRGARLFLNDGDGTFRDRSTEAGLDGQVWGSNCSHADYDNDGDLDVLIVRGGWENPAPMSLLRNRGGGRFDDATRDAGLDEPIASQSAAWADYDLDGDLDLFVCGEGREGVADDAALFIPPDALSGDDRSRLCRLYQNDGDGTFLDVTAEAGVANGRYAKGASWGDYDDDGDPDLYVSNIADPNRLYRNNGDGTFDDVAPELGLTGPRDGFACWWFDFDNDGRLDLFATDYSADLSTFVLDQIGEPAPDHPRLYRNLGPDGFEDIAATAGLDRVFLPMGAGFGDLDGDGLLDVYLATGRPGYSCLVPNVLLRNVAGDHFEDATAGSGTGHLQKGHGVGMADFDADGDLDLFVQLGGATPGDRSYNALFRNPGHGHRWVSIRLVGTRSNRSAIGVRLRVDVRTPDGSLRSIHRLVSGGTSFGGNPLSQTIGLGDAVSIESVTIRWPIAEAAPQVLDDVPLDAAIEVVEPPEQSGPVGPAARSFEHLAPEARQAADGGLIRWAERDVDVGVRLEEERHLGDG